MKKLAILIVLLASTAFGQVQIGKGVQIGFGSSGAVFPATNGLVFNTSTTTARNALFSDIVPLFTSGPTNCYLRNDGACAIPDGASSVGAAGTVQSSNGSGAFAAATFGNVTNLWMTCTGLLNADGTCPTSTVTPGNYIDANITVDSHGLVQALTTPYPRVNGCEFRYAITDTPSSTTGTAVPDTCPDTAGSPHNGTLGANPPTIGNFGALFLQAVGAVGASIQTPINTYHTLIFSYCTWPRGQLQSLSTTTTGATIGGTSANLVPVIWGSDNNTADGADIGAAGYSFVSEGMESNNPFIWTPSGPGFTSHVAGFFGGCHVQADVLDGTADRIYVDGVLQPLATTGASSSFATTGGHYQFGGIKTPVNALNSWRGWLNYAEGYTSELTDAQVAQESSNIAYIVTRRTQFPIIPSFNLANTSNWVLFLGDSIYAGFQGGTPWTVAPYFAPTNTYTILNYGLGGQLATDIAALFPQQVTGGISPGAKGTIFMDAQTNDSANSFTATQIFNAMNRTVSQIPKGVRSVYTTMISRVNNDTMKDTINPLLINNWRQMGLTALNDIAEIPGLGADGAYANTSSVTGCFNADQIHPSILTPGPPNCANGHSGYAIYAQSHTDTQNYIDGSTFANPAPAASYPYAMTYGTPVVNATTCASGTCAITLPGCDHMDDMPFYVMNYGNTGTVTVQPPSSSYYQSTGYTLNGSSSAIVIPNNSTVGFTELRGSMAAGGCSWITVNPNIGNVALLNASNIFTGFVNTFQSTVLAFPLSPGVNSNSPSLSYAGQFFNGTSTLQDQWSWTDAIGSGTTPTSTYTLTHTGTGGALAVSIPNLLVKTNIVNGAGMQIVSGSGCTISAGAIGGTCTGTITLPATEPDTSYNISGCSVVSPAAGPSSIGGLSSLTTTGFTFTQVALGTASTGGGTIECTVTHN